MTDPHLLDATALAAAIRREELSPVNVVDVFLDRIDERNDRTNAFVTVAAEHARKRARDAEAALERGEDVGPLHGVPVAVKDLTRTRDIRTTFGSPAYANYIPDEDDTVVARVRAAGGIIIGKTNTPEFGRLTVTENPVFGRSYNPWDPSKTPGGSSGGNAAALADGLVPLAIGSDAAGSIRIPSAACGTFGLIPDFGRVPHGPSQIDAFANIQPYTFCGPMTRTPRDAALLLDVLAGPDTGDPYSLPVREMSYCEALEGQLESFDLAYSPDFGGCPVDPAVQETVEDGLENIEAAGASVTTIDLEFDPPLWPTIHDALNVILQTRYVGLYRQVERDTGVDLLKTDLEITPEVVSRIEAGLELSTLDFKQAERVRTQVYETIQAVFESHDLLVTPTMARTAFDADNREPTVDGHHVDPMHGWMLTWPLNCTGNPAASLPVGTSDGLPVGLQVIGPRLKDDRVLAACDAIADVNPWTGFAPTAR